MSCAGQLRKDSFVDLKHLKTSKTKEKEDEQQIYRKAKHCSSTCVDRRPWCGLGSALHKLTSWSDVWGGTDSGGDCGRFQVQGASNRSQGRHVAFLHLH